MSHLYCTADQIGIQTGGGAVTHHESEAMRSLGPCEVWGRDQLPCQGEDPWKWDEYTVQKVAWESKDYKLAHFYAGTFSRTIAKLKEKGTKISYTAAAHDIAISRREHEKLGVPYNYPHLTDQELWKRYLQGYKDADLLIVPSTHSQKVMREFGCENRIAVIPHGCHLPEKVAPLPERFTVGYLGSYGCDKGVVYLLQAWKKLNYSDATLALAGRDSTSPWVQALVHHFGGGNIELAGWQENVSDFYNRISLYVQPSATEGFGIEVLEAMAHGRPTLCSSTAGAADIATWTYHYEDVDMLAEYICEREKINRACTNVGLASRNEARKHTWPQIRIRYQDWWKEIL